ncbi:MAG: FHA domain-containing protein, partial [Myxococcota bacterium]
ESRDRANDSEFLNESTRIDEDLMERYRAELDAQRKADGPDFESDTPFDDEPTEFELAKPALVDAPGFHADDDSGPIDPPGTIDAGSDPFDSANPAHSTIPDVLPSEHSNVSKMTENDAERLSQTDEVAQRRARVDADTVDGMVAPSFALAADDEQTDAAEPLGGPGATLEDVAGAVHGDELSLGTRDISVDLAPAGAPEPMGEAKSGPKGTLVLEVGDEGEQADPAMLPPAFPATTGNIPKIGQATQAKPSEPPPPPSADLAQRPPDGPGDEDAWAGYDDSGGWHTLTGESQVVMLDSSVSEGSAAPPEPMGDAASSAVFDSSQPGDAAERAQLIGIQGADTGRQHSLTGDEVLIGRSSRCSIVLAEPSVSRQHARIELRDDGFWVVDLDSGNGTYVNGQRITEFRVFSGDEVTFGNGTFQ